MLRSVGEHWNQVIEVKLSYPLFSKVSFLDLKVFLLLSLSCAGSALAILNEAHSFAMEAASEHVAQGFTVREDFWSGELKPGEKKIVKHQLFKGNEYWFWLGSATADALPSVSIYDAEGKLVQVESLSETNKASARVLPPKTGTYVILISVEAEEAEVADWALAYGFR